MADCDPLLFNYIENGSNKLLQNYILSHPESTNIKDSAGNLPLHKAVAQLWQAIQNETSHCQTDKKQILLKCKNYINNVILLSKTTPDKSVTNNQGYLPCYYLTLLMEPWWAFSEVLEIGDVLFDGEIVNGKDPFTRHSLLFTAVQQEQWSLTRILLRKNADTRQLKTPLHTLILSGSDLPDDVILSFISEKALTIHDKSGNTALHCVCQSLNLRLFRLIMAHNPEKNAINHEDKTPLMLLTENSHKMEVSIFKEFISQLVEGNSINFRDVHGNTCIHNACKGGNKDIIPVIIENQANVSLMNRKGETPLMAYLQTYHEVHPDIVASLITEVTINQSNANGDMPLHLACQRDRHSVILLLLQNNASMTSLNRNNETPLLVCVKQKFRAPKDLLSLLSVPQTVSFPDASGNTPLHYACQHATTEVMNLLLARGADINLSNVDGNTSLHMACVCQCNDVIAHLLKYQPNICIMNNLSETPLLIYLKSYGNVQVDIVSSLATAVSIDQPDCLGETPIHLACRKSYCSVMSLLLYRNALITSVNINKETPLLVLAKENFAVPKALISCLISPSTISVPDITGNTPLHYACQQGNAEMIELCLDHNAEVAGVNQDGNTCLDEYCRSYLNYAKHTPIDMHIFECLIPCSNLGIYSTLFKILLDHSILLEGPLLLMLKCLLRYLSPLKLDSVQFLSRNNASVPPYILLLDSNNILQSPRNENDILTENIREYISFVLCNTHSAITNFPQNLDDDNSESYTQMWEQYMTQQMEPKGLQARCCQVVRQQMVCRRQDAYESLGLPKQLLQMVSGELIAESLYDMILVNACNTDPS